MTSARHTVLATLLVAALALAGCNRNEHAAPKTALPSPAAAADGAVSAAVTEAAAVAAGAVSAYAATAPAEEPLLVAFAYAGSATAGGASMAHEQGRKAMEAALGGQVKSTVVQSVADADAEQQLRDLAARGNKVVFGTAPGYVDAVARLAEEFPDVKWEQAASLAKASNLRGYDVRAYQGAYLAGVIAGRMTHTDTLGFVASVPVPAVIRNIDAFTLGAQSVNPSARTKVAWINGWFDPGRESEAAQALINAGADVLLQSTGSTAPMQVAEKAGKFAFGWGGDMKAHGPKAHLGSVVVDWGRYYTRAVRQVLEDAWRAETSWWGVKEGAVDLVSLSDEIPADVKALVAERKQALADGSLRIWKGPMLTSENKEILPTGSVADDKFIGGVMFYVKGVEGKVPAGS